MLYIKGIDNKKTAVMYIAVCFFLILKIMKSLFYQAVFDLTLGE